MTTAAYPISIQWTTLFASATADVQSTAQQPADGAEAANTAAEDPTGAQPQIQAASFGMAGGLGSSTDPWSWGANYYGELGTGVTPGTGGGPTPAQIIGFGPVSGLSAGTNHALALKSDGSVWGWGLNESGQVGNPTVPGTGQPANPASATSEQSTPIQVVGAGGSGFLSNISAVAAGGTHSVALKNDGTGWAWGSNENGELGAPSSSTCTDAYGNFPCSLTRDRTKPWEVRRPSPPLRLTPWERQTRGTTA